MCRISSQWILLKSCWGPVFLGRWQDCVQRGLMDLQISFAWELRLRPPSSTSPWLGARPGWCLWLGVGEWDAVREIAGKLVSPRGWFGLASGLSPGLQVFWLARFTTQGILEVVPSQMTPSCSRGVFLACDNLREAQGSNLMGSRKWKRVCLDGDVLQQHWDQICLPRKPSRLRNYQNACVAPKVDPRKVPLLGGRPARASQTSQMKATCIVQMKVVCAKDLSQRQTIENSSPLKPSVCPLAPYPIHTLPHFGSHQTHTSNPPPLGRALILFYPPAKEQDVFDQLIDSISSESGVTDKDSNCYNDASGQSTDGDLVERWGALLAFLMLALIVDIAFSAACHHRLPRKARSVLGMLISFSRASMHCFGNLNESRVSSKSPLLTG